MFSLPKRLTKSEFIERARKVHGDKYDYSKVKYVNNNTKIEIICPEHGPFWQTPHNHLQTKGCPACGKSQPNTTESFIKKARAVHGTKYNYNLVHFTRNKDKVEIVCPIHGQFWQEANSHLQGHGCPRCKAERLEGSHPERGKAIREATLKKYGFENTMQDAAVKNLMEATKIQNKTYRSSKPENELYHLLVAKFGKDDVIRQYKDMDLYPFMADFFIISRRMFIELNTGWIHGNRWFDPLKDYYLIKRWVDKKMPSYNAALHSYLIRDVAKREAARARNLNYVVFWRYDLKDAKEWIEAGAPNSHDFISEYYWKNKENE